MRKKIAMRWRRRAMCMGATILSEGMVFSKKDLHKEGFERRDNGYRVRAKYKGRTYDVADDDILAAYKLLCWCMEPELIKEPK